MDLESGLIHELIAREVIDMSDKMEIEAENNSMKRNEILLSIMEKESPEEFHEFCEALKKTGQHHIVGLLEGHSELMVSCC